MTRRNARTGINEGAAPVVFAGHGSEDRMLDGRSFSIHAALCVLLVCLFAVASSPPSLSKKGDKKRLEFAAQMARAGSWREATFRWNGAIENEPGNAHLYNNLGVGGEALGQWDEASLNYEKALELEPDNFHIQENYRRFSIFRELLRRHEQGQDTKGMPSIPFQAGGAKRRGKVFQTTVGLPMPPRLKLNGDESILVISFLDDETRFLDINREMVRYLRSAFTSRTAHPILDIVPPPAVPEQTPEDLLANKEFWKFLHREYGADLIVSGVLGFDREDISGYQDVDVVSSTTGQKIRQTRFVEQERFSYHVEVFFIDGLTGEPLFRDRFQRSAIIRGSQNDPITTFFDLSDTIASEVLAIVTTRVRADTRAVFKF